MAHRFLDLEEDFLFLIARFLENKKSPRSVGLCVSKKCSVGYTCSTGTGSRYLTMKWVFPLEPLRTTVTSWSSHRPGTPSGVARLARKTGSSWSPILPFGLSKLARIRIGNPAGALVTGVLCFRAERAIGCVLWLCDATPKID